MNVGLTLTCGTCDGDTDCRIGFSNRTIQPLQLACPHCQTLMEITLDISQAPGYSLTFKNASNREDRSYRGPFDGRNPFFDLHLDFPVRSGNYVAGFTPFLVAIDALRGGDLGDSLPLMMKFSGKMNLLNQLAMQDDDIRRTIRLYFGANKQLFKQRASTFLDHDFGPSLDSGTIDDVLYSYLSRISASLIDIDKDAEWTEQAMQRIEALAEAGPDAFDALLAHLDETQFLSNLRRDCIGLYCPTYSAEISLRPAIFLDLVQGPDGPLVSGRVSSKEFGTYKDLYKDMCEVYSRQLNLVAALNNLAHRGDFNAFAPNEQGATLSSLDRFADKVLSDKFKYLPDSWVPLDPSAVDIGIRNAIAHNTVRYDEVNQIISYFPHKEGVRQDQEEIISYLGFMRKLLILFRDVHAVHQLVWLLGHHIYAWRARTGAGARLG
ncbi:hypothetical protein JY452_06620 [Stenotrophomonas maltophilia]|uniref:hypothetical protein n=1 Tax=Stenotrophomonas TaxID=40323 RepID=UPI0006C4E481|nr:MULTISPECIES: hypothetical protein [Stenotrophomonas]KOO80639.1 hypothetical protein VO93_19580 [Stenotrophomonas maltophilia]MBN5125664.1 hypothetical protein [Stenotrophomonas maltophilia]MBN5176701.1 hypothetical protein [Stenotrophomonas maltophilia]MCU1124194.1 hypothetical protein [Stenotrophomonas maltophilia]MDQ7276437.1 hypothetical protein [Stenotrophomonas sp. Sm3147]